MYVVTWNGLFTVPYECSGKSSGNVYIITEMYKYEKNYIMVYVPD